jgi:cytochrome c556
MLRKLAVLSLTMAALAGFTLAADDDDETPTRKIMEQINKHHNDIRKATRTAPEYKKSVAKIPEYTEKLIVEAKKAREIKDSAEKAKKPLKEWQKMMDEMIASAQDLSKVAAKKGSTQAQAKEAYNTYNKTCTACHDIFKKDDE